MTPEQIRTVKQSFARIFPIKAKLSYDFYERLFEIAPDVRPLFSEDIAIQREKLADTLAWAVRNLDSPSVLAEVVQGLARRHVTYGALPVHYPVVGAALIHALQLNAPGGLSEAETGAWTAAFETLSDIMIEASWPEHPPGPG
ncbi:globin domain-containing protein [Mangrovicoccus sp. HB161399]|uniref:globin domain-containing protein n=1 Tax=Mangrovicoccus sp. HB161399 TaxID=2720392 RepID=UPI001552C305|nr:globin domain-containing protein [Mangrovicoccus sp. HB161399]